MTNEPSSAHVYKHASTDEGCVPQSKSTNVQERQVRGMHVQEGAAMKSNLEKVKTLARDLRDDKESPRKPRETLAGYALAARAVGQMSAVLWVGKGIIFQLSARSAVAHVCRDRDYDEFRLFVATGATDEEVADGSATMPRNGRRPRSTHGTSGRCGADELREPRELVSR